MDHNQDEFELLWREFRSGNLSAIETGQRFLQAAVQSQGSVTTDLDRKRRCGYPEVIYGAGKSPESIRLVADALLQTNHEVLVTRVTPEQVRTLSEMYLHTRWSHVGRTLRIGRDHSPIAAENLESNANAATPPRVAVVSAGTTDESVAVEARETLTWMGLSTVLIQDIGVAGPYRLLAHVPILQRMSAIVCVAGMEGALPSVLAGHVRCPVIAVPTSVGYGANFAGLSALLSMLNSCAANVAVVNIDAGFKAGYLAGLIATGPQTRLG
ncbi:MAG: nickel pincer cofactor biosynthesis protein LarB [Pirellula sp.]